MLAELQKIVAFLQSECGEDDMASIKINNKGRVFF